MRPVVRLFWRRQEYRHFEKGQKSVSLRYQKEFPNFEEQASRKIKKYSSFYKKEMS